MNPVPKRRDDRARSAGCRRGAVLPAAGAGAVVAGAMWAAAAFGPGGAWEEPLKPVTVADSAGPENIEPAEAELPSAVKAQLDSTNPLDAVQGLAAVRSRAFSSGRLELLDLVNSPGTPAAAADARIKAGLQGSGNVLAGFTSTVSDLQVQPGSSSSLAVVRLTSATSSYEERDSSGAVVAAGAPAAEQDLKLVLVSVEGKWRIRDVLPGS